MTLSLGTKPQLTIDAAKLIANAAIAEAMKQNLLLSIAIVDDGGHLLYFTRMSEKASPGSVEGALTKAKSASMYRRSTADWEQAAKERPVVMKIPYVMPLGGGVSLIVDGVIVGAIGVSGASAPQDDEIARVGAKLLG